jgi:hypothetical protein
MTMGKLICEKEINGETVLLNLTTAAGVAAALVKSTPGVGKSYWYWPSMPAGQVIAADFTGAPVATADTATNSAAIAAITATPEEVLTYAP